MKLVIITVVAVATLEGNRPPALGDSPVRNKGGPDRNTLPLGFHHMTAPARPANRPPPRRRSLIAGAVGLSCLLAFQILSAVPGVAEILYGGAVGPAIAWLLSTVTGVIPFSFIELIMLAYAGWLGYGVWRAIADVRRGRRDVRNALVGGGLRVVRHAGVIVSLFYVLWGFNYARAPLTDRLGWPGWQVPAAPELERLARHIVDAANDAYRVLHDTTDAGIPTPMPDDLRALDRAIEQGWQHAADALGLPRSVTWRRAPVKRLVLSPVVARFGISGMYSPWTGEANVLRSTPAVTRPLSMAHEKAHQRGIGPEAEASFLGFIAASRAPHPHARYAAYVFAQRQILSVLAQADRQAWQDIAAGIDPGVRRDLDDLFAYWRRYRGIGTRIGRAVNDRYLRANRVRAGVASYARSVRLLITFARERGGRLTPEPAPPDPR